jgi:hypothetical protein
MVRREENRQPAAHCKDAHHDKQTKEHQTYKKGAKPLHIYRCSIAAVIWRKIGIR